MSELTHFNEQGRANMVDVSGKAVTRRVAVAAGEIGSAAGAGKEGVANKQVILHQ